MCTKTWEVNLKEMDIFEDVGVEVRRKLKGYCVVGVLSLGIKRLGREVSHSAPSSAGIYFQACVGTNCCFFEHSTTAL